MGKGKRKIYNTTLNTDLTKGIRILAAQLGKRQNDLLEEAIWDVVGIPRLLILNGDMSTMQKSGWAYCRGNDLVLGDEAVKMGRRVAHWQSDGWCTIWREPNAPTEAM